MSDLVVRNTVKERLAKGEVASMGARYVSTGTDLGFLLAAATAQAKQVRELET